MKKAFYFLVVILLMTSTFPQHHGKKWKFFSWNDEDFFRWGKNGHPMIEITYGESQFKQKDLFGKLSKSGSFGLKLGYASHSQYDDYLIRLTENYLSFNTITAGNKLNKDNNYDYKTEAWQVGYGNRKGLGYTMDDFSIIPFIQTGYNIIKFDNNFIPEKNSALTRAQFTADSSVFGRYGNTMRFSYQNASGVKIEMGEMFAITGYYEVNNIYPRIKTWETIGSLALQTISSGMLDSFIDEIEDEVPEAAPIVSFVLKSALNYTFYHFRKEKMNWPFNSESPITYESFHIGTTITF